MFAAVATILYKKPAPQRQGDIQTKELLIFRQRDQNLALFRSRLTMLPISITLEMTDQPIRDGTSLLLRAIPYLVYLLAKSMN